MSPFRFIGLVITIFAYVAGGFLVAQPFVATINASTVALALLFPACLGIGLPLYTSGNTKDRGLALRVSGWGLLLLGLGALTGIFIDVLGILPATGTLVLWVLFPAAICGGLLLTYFAGALDHLQAEGHATE